MTRNSSGKFVDRIWLALLFGFAAATPEFRNPRSADRREAPQPSTYDSNRYSVSDSPVLQKYRLGDSPEELIVKGGLNVKISLVRKPKYNAWQCQITPLQNQLIRTTIRSLLLTRNNSPCGYLKIEFSDSQRHSKEFGCLEHMNKDAATSVHDRPIFLTMILYDGIIDMNLISDTPGFNLICSTFPVQTLGQRLDEYILTTPRTTDNPGDDKGGNEKDDDADDDKDITCIYIALITAGTVVLIVTMINICVCLILRRKRNQLYTKPAARHIYDQHTYQTPVFPTTPNSTDQDHTNMSAHRSVQENDPITEYENAPTYIELI